MSGNVTCKICQKVFLVKRCDFTRRKTCSLKCRSRYMSLTNHGDKNPLWKGGKIYIGKYRYLKAYDHPKKNSSGYVAEHRLVVEKKLGRYLSSDEEVHHVNGIKDDNRLENLEVVKRNNHRGLTKCPHCQKEFYIK